MPDRYVTESPVIFRNDSTNRIFYIRFKHSQGVEGLGWDVCADRTAKYEAWAGLASSDEPRGTEEAFNAYCVALKAAQRHASETGKRCNAFLIPELVDREGSRVEVRYPDGEIKRFKVGKSTGWAPCHLELANARSRGGGPVYWPPGTKLLSVIRA